MELNRNFIMGRMNKSADERIVPQGETIHAVNMRFNSTENSDVGTGENTFGNIRMTELTYNGSPLSPTAKCIGAFEDGIDNTMYWFVHSPDDGVDMIVSYNEVNSQLIYHIISTSVLNFNEDNLILSVNRIDDLVFFTDYRNEPRVFNRKKVYPSEPDLLATDILVIKAPPAKAPGTELVTTSGENTFIDTRFVSFAYKYKYADGEYSALSSWSSVSFIPKFFRLNTSTYQNDGMTNLFNGVIVSMDTGSDRVKEIMLCFRIGNESVVNVVEIYDKRKMGWTDNSTVTQLFTGNKIFTTLNPSELLRLFDNVPTKAFAQTLMGNRLMYGNYTDGFPLIDDEGNEFSSVFSVGLESESIGVGPITSDTISATYNIDPSAQSNTIDDATIRLDLTGIELKEGTAIGIEATFRRDSFTGTGSPETGPSDVSIQFFIVLKQDYATPFQLASSDEFIEAIGADGTFVGLSQCGTNNEGSTLTDRFICQVTSPSLPSPGWQKVDTGIDSTGQGFAISASPGSSIITLTAPAIVHESISNPSDLLYEYFSVVDVLSSVQKVSNNSSMKSNRDYTVSIIYLDEFNRQTTGIVSPDNTIHVPASRSVDKNVLTVNIPANQKPPEFATRYKFAVMPSGGDYEAIYTNQFFIDPLDGSTYFKLEGDNQNKCKIGDRLIVKVDSNGPLSRLVETVVLDISPKERDFIDGNVNDAGQDIEEPPGLYMRLKPDNWSAFYDPDNVLGGETFSARNTWPVVAIPVSSEDPSDPTQHIPWEVPEGSIVRFDFVMGRDRRGSTGSRLYTYRKEYIANRNYASLFDFIVGQNIRFDTGIDSGSSLATNENVFFGCIFDIANPDPACPFEINNIENQINKYQFSQAANGQLWFNIRVGLRTLSGPFSVTTPWINASITIIKASNTIVFETQPQETNPDIYFIGSEVYPIENGFHVGGEQDQTQTDPAIIKLDDIFNCFSFGNGVESYKVRDALAGQPFRMGQVVTSVSGQDYGEQDRYASITYSGIYNPETNVNNLNEFNLGLANFKDLEKIFGPIKVMHPRQTDILVLQEDKISRVLAGKNLLNDSVGGGTIASIPEVLGTQIARVEEYGISNNPESFSTWGGSVFFTDVKRNSVLMMVGDDRIRVISDDMMRPWFRDRFIERPNEKILGAYDPFSKEYILSFTSEDRPLQPVISPCGFQKNILTGREGVTEYDVQFGPEVGQVDIDFNINFLPSGSSLRFIIEYGTTTVDSGVLTSEQAGTLSFNKDSVVNNKAKVTVIQVGAVTSWSLEVGCPQSDTIEVFRVTVNSPLYDDQLIHHEFGWSEGSFESPINSESVVLNGPGDTFRLSQFSGVQGPEGVGSIPVTDSNVRIISNKRTGDNFDFDPSFHKLRYLISDTLYGASDIETILSLSTETQLINPSPGKWKGEFMFDRPNDERYLYLVYDYRKSVEISLCYDSESAIEACCKCEPEPEPGPEPGPGNSSTEISLCYDSDSAVNACCNC